MDNEWTEYTSQIEGVAPFTTFNKDEYEIQFLSKVTGNYHKTSNPSWLKGYTYLYKKKVTETPMPTYEQVKLWCETNKQPVPEKPVNYEAWRPSLESFGWFPEHPFSDTDKAQVDLLVKAFRVGFKLLECMEDINNA